MIRRTLQEWQSLPYGDGENHIPQWAADRIAAVARSSPLGGADGSRILVHGRTCLRAGQVVGVLAANGCALEILPKIDGIGVGAVRRQLIHMLGVAFDLPIDPGGFTELGWQRDTLLAILIRLFASKLNEAIRRGMPRNYLNHEDDLPTLRGRMNAVRQFTTLASSPQKIACRFDALSPDIALNHIMKAALTRLEGLSCTHETRRSLRELSFAYAEVADVPLEALQWHKVVLDRTNARWRELLSLARLLLQGRFQTTSSGTGLGFSLLFEMNALFEQYVARMLARALRPFGLRVVSQGGRRYCLEEVGTDARRFQTKPDILVKRGTDTVLVVDTKWKLLARQIDDPKCGVSQADVYQMMAYGRLYRCPRLMLLYPHHSDLEAAAGIVGDYRVRQSQDRLLAATVQLEGAEGIAHRLAGLVNQAIGLSPAVA